jgi:hypothetical protein
MSKTNKPLAKQQGVVVRQLDGEVLIYDLKTDKAYTLNSTAAAVWNACDGINDVEDIGKLIEQQFGSNHSEEMVWLALSQLAKQDLIEGASAVPTLHQGLSRRQVIKTIGLASVVAIPLVSSLVAPQAAHATSAACAAGGNPKGTACTCPAGTNVGSTCPADGTGCAGANCNCLVNVRHFASPSTGTCQ